MNRVELPWPPKDLSPNQRFHFHAKAKAAKAYRESAYWLAVAAGMAAPAEGPVALRIDFYPPDKRRRDLDNMLASIKAGIDGIADAMIVDDQRFGFHISRCEPVKRGKVVVSLVSAEARPIGEIIAPIVASIIGNINSAEAA